MKMKRICSLVMAGAMTLGVVLSNGVSAYAAAEDWIKVDVDSEGNPQPSTKYVLYRPDYGWHEISYGYTIHSGYQYALRLPYDPEWGYGKEGDPTLGDGIYAYQQMNYEDFNISGNPDYDKIIVNSLNVVQYTKEDIEEIFSPEYYSTTLPADKEIVIRVDGNNITDADMERVLATGWVLVYDENGNFVDEFSLSAQPTVSVSEMPAETTQAVPVTDVAADTTVPVIDAVPAADTTATVQQTVNPSNIDGVAAVAKEVLKGKWGVGNERRVRLEAAGYDYKEVQKKVYELMK